MRKMNGTVIYNMFSLLANIIFSTKSSLVLIINNIKYLKGGARMPSAHSISIFSVIGNLKPRLQIILKYCNQRFGLQHVRRVFVVSLGGSSLSFDRSQLTRSEAHEAWLREHTLVYKIETAFFIIRAY